MLAEVADVVRVPELVTRATVNGNLPFRRRPVAGENRRDIMRSRFIVSPRVRCVPRAEAENQRTASATLLLFAQLLVELPVGSHVRVATGQQHAMHPLAELLVEARVQLDASLCCLRGIVDVELPVRRVFRLGGQEHADAVIHLSMEDVDRWSNAGQAFRGMAAGRAPETHLTAL